MENALNVFVPVKVWFALNVARFAVVVPLTMPLLASVVTMELAVRCVLQRSGRKSWHS